MINEILAISKNIYVTTWRVSGGPLGCLGGTLGGPGGPLGVPGVSLGVPGRSWASLGGPRGFSGCPWGVPGPPWRSRAGFQKCPFSLFLEVNLLTVSARIDFFEIERFCGHGRWSMCCPVCYRFSRLAFCETVR